MRGNRMIGAKLRIWLIPGWLTSPWLMSIVLAAASGSAALASELSVTPATMARIGTIDERYQSYNIEMVEVTGGRILEAYGPNAPDSPGANSNRLAAADRSDQRSIAQARRGAGAGLSAGQRHLGQRHLLRGFGHRAAGAPAGFNGVLTRRQWQARSISHTRSRRGS